jgi:hypothetical protein
MFWETQVFFPCSKAKYTEVYRLSSGLLYFENILSKIYFQPCWLYGLTQIQPFISIFAVIFFTYLPESQIKKNNSIYSNKFFHNFHLSRASGKWFNVKTALVFLFPKIIELFGFPFFWLWSLPNEGYSTNVLLDVYIFVVKISIGTCSCKTIFFCSIAKIIVMLSFNFLL